jgi:hypothetical protein
LFTWDVSTVDTRVLTLFVKELIMFTHFALIRPSLTATAPAPLTSADRFRLGLRVAVLLGVLIDVPVQPDPRTDPAGVLSSQVVGSVSGRRRAATDPLYSGLSPGSAWAVVADG